jgi:hypothetical protein
MEAEIKGIRHFGLQAKCPSFLNNRNETYIISRAQESPCNLKMPSDSSGEKTCILQTDIKYMTSLGWKRLGALYAKT